MSVFWRYWLLQVPGWVVLGAALAFSHSYFALPLHWVAIVFGVWVVKDAAFYPMLKRHYEFRDEDATRRLVGRSAVAREPLSPRGYVELGGELWLAEVGEGESPVGPGERVTVEGVAGLTLLVRRHEKR